MATGDPYAVLGVSSAATPDEIRWAYERRLAEASRSGAVRAASDVDAAYAVLSNPRRRALYDRHGIADPLPDRHPLASVPASREPFRAWSPSDVSRPVAPRGCPGRERNAVRVGVAMVALALVVTGSGYLYHHLRRPAPAGAPAALAPAPNIRPTYLVPIAPTGQELVSCEATPAGPGYRFIAHSGDGISCTNGATPIFQPYSPTPNSG